MPREVEAARLPRLALTLHLREALAVQLEHSQPLRLSTHAFQKQVALF